MPSPVAALKAVLTEKTFFAESKLSPDLVERLRDLAPAEQQQVVAMFIAAAKRYDDGHRPQDGTTVDVMLNDVFPAFGSSALLALFDHFRKLAYLTTDEMDALIAPAFANLDRKVDKDRLVRFFTAYAEEVLGEDDDSPDEYAVKRLQEIFQEVGKQLPPEERASLAARIERAADLPAWEEAELARLKKLPVRDFEKLMRPPSSDLFHLALFARRDKQSDAAYEAYATAMLDVPETYAVADMLKQLFVRDPDHAKAALLRIARRGKLHRHGALDTLEDLIRWSKERSHAVTDLAKAAERPNVVRAMKATFTALKRLVAKLDAEDAAALPARLDAIGATELAAELATLGLAYGYNDPATPAFHRAVLRHLDGLAFDALLGYARVCIAAHAYPALEPALVYLFLKDAKQAHAFILSREGIRGRGATNTAMIALTAEQMKDATRWPRDPWRKVLKESPATLKLLAAAKAALQPCFDNPLERVELR